MIHEIPPAESRKVSHVIHLPPHFGLRSLLVVLRPTQNRIEPHANTSPYITGSFIFSRATQGSHHTLPILPLRSCRKDEEVAIFTSSKVRLIPAVFPLRVTLATSGESEVVIAPGIESTARIPLGIPAQQGPGMSFVPFMAELSTLALVSQGLSSAMICDKWGLVRT